MGGDAEIFSLVFRQDLCIGLVILPAPGIISHQEVPPFPQLFRCIPGNRLTHHIRGDVGMEHAPAKGGHSRDRVAHGVRYVHYVLMGKDLLELGDDGRSQIGPGQKVDFVLFDKLLGARGGEADVSRIVPGEDLQLSPDDPSFGIDLLLRKH